MVLTETGLAKVFQRIKSFVASQLNSKASAIHTHTSSDITDLPSGYVVDSALSSSSENPVQNKVVKNALDGKAASSHTHTTSEISDFPTINDATLTIKVNGTTVGTFTANQATNEEINITAGSSVTYATKEDIDEMAETWRK